MKKIFLLLALLLASCGFKPMYNNEPNDHTHTLLPEINIATLESNQRYKLRNYLEDELDPNNDTVEKLFDLDVKITDTISDLLVQKDSTITKKQHNLSALYTLRNKEDQKIIDQGTITISSSFSELPSEYATYAISEKTYDNALKEIASTLKKRLVIALMKYQKSTDENTSK